MTNKRIRTKMFETGMKQWELAILLGMSESVLSRKLRKELPEEEQDKIIKAIESGDSEKPGSAVESEKITRYDIIKQMSKTEMADWLCTLMTDIADEETEFRDNGDACYKICPAQHLCKPSDIRGYGWFEYLTKEPGTGKGYFKEMEFAISRFFEWSDQAIKEAKGESK